MLNFLSEEANQEYLASQIPGVDRDLYLSFGHNQFESAFIDRVFVVYQPTGLNADCTHRQPEIITMLKVIRFEADAHFGCCALVQDTRTGNVQRVGHVPTRIGDLKLFMQIPPYLSLRFETQRDRNGAHQSSLMFGLLIKTANRSDFFSAGNTYCLPPNKFRRFFPNTNLRLG